MPGKKAISRILIPLLFCSFFYAQMNGQVQYKPSYPALAPTPLKYQFTDFLTFEMGKSLSRSETNLYKPQTFKFDQKKSLAFFCRIEEQVAQKSALAMRLRLGSLDYVNYLERKDPYRPY